MSIYWQAQAYIRWGQESITSRANQLKGHIFLGGKYVTCLFSEAALPPKFFSTERERESWEREVHWGTLASCKLSGPRSQTGAVASPLRPIPNKKQGFGVGHFKFSLVTCNRTEDHRPKQLSWNLLAEWALKPFSNKITPLFFSTHRQAKRIMFDTHPQLCLTFCPFLTEDWALCSLFPELPWIFIHCLHFYKLESSKMNESSESEKTHSVMRAEIYYLISI